MDKMDKLDKTFDVTSVDDKISWTATCTLMLLVRRPDSDRALCIHCAPVGSTWMLTKTVVVTGGFDAVVGAMGQQEQVGVFDDLQEAIGAGSMVAKKWLADPTADTAP